MLLPSTFCQAEPAPASNMPQWLTTLGCDQTRHRMRSSISLVLLAPHSSPTPLSELTGEVCVAGLVGLCLSTSTSCGGAGLGSGAKVMN